MVRPKYVLTMADDALFMCDVPVQCYNNLFMRLLTRLIKMLNFVAFHVTAVQGYICESNSLHKPFQIFTVLFVFFLLRYGSKWIFIIDNVKTCLRL